MLVSSFRSQRRAITQQSADTVRGMFERSEGNVQKGRFAQATAAKIEDDNLEVVVPDYIVEAVTHVQKNDEPFFRATGHSRFAA